MLNYPCCTAASAQAEVEVIQGEVKKIMAKLLLYKAGVTILPHSSSYAEQTMLRKSLRKHHYGK